MVEYHTPGIYVEEVSTGPKPIESVSTTIAAFIGVAPKGNAFVNEVREINSMEEFHRTYWDDDSPPTDLAYGLYGYFMNGGRRAYVLNIGPGGTVAGDGRKTGIGLLKAYDEPSTVLAPGFTGIADQKALIDHAEEMKDRVAILDGPATITDTAELTQVAEVSPDEASDAKEPGGKRSNAPKGRKPSPSKFAACYFPWIVIDDPFSKEREPEKRLRTVPPSGHMAGIFALNDMTRGVHKAPANYSIRTAIGVSQRITDDQQGVLNRAGINCIRSFASMGIRVWGARLLSLDPEWRYLNVRRCFIMLEKSIINGTRWSVFEPNDQVTRNSVARDCRDFLTRQWRNGALVGATREQAFFVKCDAENNPRETVDAGLLIIDIGVAPSRPAEFIVFRIGQWSGGTDVKSA